MASELESEDTAGSGLNIYQRIREVKREVVQVDKAGKHQQGFAFMRHDDVTAALAGAFVKWGIDREVTVIHQNRHENILELMVRVAWVNVDRPEDRKVVEFFCEGVNVVRRDGSGVNNDGLAAGKAISYGVKMAELKNFCLTGDTTPDSEKGAGSFDSAPVAPPTEAEYTELKQLYESCSTKEELLAIRTKMMPYVHQKKLSPEQMTSLSKLDADAKERIK